MDGSDDDFCEYVDARRPAMVRALVLTGCSTAEAEDQVQTALLRCYRSWSRIRAAGDPDAYVFRVLYNSFKDSRARRWRGEQPTGELPEPSQHHHDPAETISTGLTVRSALLRISQRHRTVLVLRFLADLSERQVAEVLGVPLGTVKSRTARALTELSQDPDLGQLTRKGIVDGQ